MKSLDRTLHHHNLQNYDNSQDSFFLQLFCYAARGCPEIDTVHAVLLVVNTNSSNKFPLVVVYGSYGGP